MAPELACWSCSDWRRSPGWRCLPCARPAPWGFFSPSTWARFWRCSSCCLTASSCTGFIVSRRSSAMRWNDRYPSRWSANRPKAGLYNCGDFYHDFQLLAAAATRGLCGLPAVFICPNGSNSGLLAASDRVPERSRMAQRRLRLIIGITGASGVAYGVRLLQVLREAEVETHLVISRAGQMTLAQEEP